MEMSHWSLLTRERKKEVTGKNAAVRQATKAEGGASWFECKNIVSKSDLLS